MDNNTVCLKDYFIKYLFILYLACQYCFSQNVVAHDVYFETDAYKVSVTEHKRLMQFINALENYKINHIEIHGYCDDRGTDSYNLVLSQKRADAIKTLVKKSNIDSSLIKSVDGKGEVILNYVKSKTAAIIRSLNRKVEIVIALNNSEKSDLGNTLKQDTETILKGTVNVGEKIVLENILFKINYSFVLPESRKTLDRIAFILKERQELYFTILGHVCCTKYNKDAIDKKTNKRNLSVARAKYVYDYFIKKGINKNRMKYVGLRGKFPLGGDPKFDRRVEIQITYISEKN